MTCEGLGRKHPPSSSDSISLSYICRVNRLAVQSGTLLYQLMAERLVTDVQVWHKSMNCCVGFVLAEEANGEIDRSRSVR
jgi:hypothetical protein